MVEKYTGQILPFNESVFSAFNLIPTIIVVVLVPIAFVLLRPRDEDVEVFRPVEEAPIAAPILNPTLAQRMNHSRVVSYFVVLLGLAFLVVDWSTKGFSLDANTVILIFLILGIGLHGAPVAYVDAMKNAARQTGTMFLQYPLYGGIMGIMNATGLAAMISQFFVAISTQHTLPFWTYFASLFITFLVPSGGGHWAVQGPFAIPAALALHASVPATTMGVAMGEQVSNMMQPFWAVPVVAIAGIGIQRVLGYTVITFLISAVVYGAALVLLT
jgi:short-chain fatty acids transporter